MTSITDHPHRLLLAAMRTSSAGAFMCLLMLFVMVPIGCSSESGESGAPDGGAELSIVCTTGMVADIVEHVAGERVTVTHLIGEGVDPHMYRATRSDVNTLQSADVIFYSGLHLEGKMADVLVKVGRTKPVYAVTELIDEAYLLEPEGAEGEFDPHVWMDISGWMRAVDVVAKALAAEDPQHASEYEANARVYRDELAALHQWAGKAVASIPERGRVLITAHDAFNYFGRAYGLEVLGIQGISTESEAGLDDINRLVDLIVRRGVSAVFVESSVAAKNVRALVEGARARGVDLRIGGELYSDAMGPRGTRAGTYIGMLEHNVVTIVSALGGTIPAHPSFGQTTGTDRTSADEKAE